MRGRSGVVTEHPARGHLRRALGPAAGVVLAGMLLAGPAAAAPPSQGGPVDLLTEADLRIDGPATAAFSARSVAVAGDLNGDGIDDIVVGAPQTDEPGPLGEPPLETDNTGSAYVVFGSALPGPVDLAAPGARGFRITGAATGDFAGTSVARAGDVNGDGLDDLIVGARLADNNGRMGSGSAYVIFGSTTAVGDVDLGALGPRGFRIDGAADSNSAGGAVAGAGDVNGDGFADVIVGAANANNNGRSTSGSAWVVFGSATPADVDLLAPGPAAIRIDGAAADDEAGGSVAGAGDVNGDGRDDVIVGAAIAGNNGRPDSGSAYVVFGSATPVGVDLSALGAAGFRIDGQAPGDRAGAAVAGAGDLNGDGRDDVIVGAANADNGGLSASGSAHVVFGSAAPTGVDLATLGAAGIRIDGAAAGDRLGLSVAAAGDIDGDGRDDVIVGAPQATNNGRAFAGAAYVVFGSATPATVSAGGLGPNGFRIDGAAGSPDDLSLGDAAGRSVAGDGDVNGDGRADVLVGADSADANLRENSGSAFVVHGFGATATGDALAFGERTVGAPPTAILNAIVRSTGLAPLRPGGVSIEGPDAPRFAVVADTCTGSVVAPGGTCTLALTFAPLAAGTATAELVMTSNDPASPLRIALTGTGVAAAPAPVAPAPFACTLPRRPTSLSLRTGLTQLRINQRISIAAIRRLNSIAARLDGRPEPRPGTGRRGTIRATTTQLRINQRIAEAGFRRARALYVRLGGTGAPVLRSRARTIRLTRAGVGLNQLTNIRALDMLNCITRNQG